MRSSDDMDRVRSLARHGPTSRAIAAETGVAYSTVLRWRRGTCRAFGDAPELAPWRPADDAAYAYLLGMYLGDGCLAHLGRTWRLDVARDLAYPVSSRRSKPRSAR